MAIKKDGEEREFQLNFRLSAKDRQRLDRLAAHYEFSASQVLRVLLRQAVEHLDRAEAAR